MSADTKSIVRNYMTNIVSAHVCEKLGGELMDKIQAYNDAEGHHIMRRYWIYL